MNTLLHALLISAALMLAVVAINSFIAASIFKRVDENQLSIAQKSLSLDGQTELVSRRSIISWMPLAWAAFSASALTTTAATSRFMFPNVLFEPPSTFKAGLPKEVPPGTVDTRFKERFGIWLVHDVDPVSGDDSIVALSDICTHLGCIPNWLEDAQKFKCPCHGSGYYKNGINFEGPTPRPLERFAISLADDEQILVDKNRKFQYEKGEWSNTDSFLRV
jgi:cytochrome b6-f complex iron-sulfur subunit